ncbi:hypothetical protein EO95_01890 [Methanosarcina sp. 1.H.T.1A.1]|uniref:hypothetical protein n=1 Tax=Methanosarcina sp. 1.H.T.1A.1 TaxID=1483602 RepID=UPI000621AD9F|nr:hypothetical protein [Methanosarcina sp. 1.H.T.1A.1]KKH97948.1 hypothetical protein EO95_01890 [Methanosarcina sp. 1.H.T.1A.1]
MSLSEKKNCLKVREFTFRLFSLIVFLIFFGVQASPVSGAMDGTIAGEESTLINDEFIIDFFSDHDLSDATVRFKQPLENVSLVFTLSSGKEILKSETFHLGSVDRGQEVTKVLFWGLEEDFGKDRDSYTAQLFVKDGSQNLESRKLSFSYRNPYLSNLKVVDFSADSEKASVLITLTSSANLGFVQVPEPGIADLDLKLLSGTDIIYSENLENVPVTDAYYKAMNWPFLLEKDRNYTAILKVHSHSPALTTAYTSDFRAEEKVEILDTDIDVDEYGASVTVVGKSQVPFDGIIRVVLTPEEGDVQVFEETADILTAGKEDTVGIIWQGVPRGDYNVKVYVLNLKGEIMDSHETVLRVFEPVAEINPSEESPAFGFQAALGIFLCFAVFQGRKRKGKKEGR